MTLRPGHKTPTEHIRREAVMAGCSQTTTVGLNITAL